MNRHEFMRELEQLLSDLSSAEREEALQFYDDYFTDAGPENEQQVLTSLGSPEKTARTIREGLGDKAESMGEFTENGYHSGAETRDEIQPRETYHNGNRKLSTGIIILLVILGVFALPLLGGIGTGIIALLIGILVTAAALIFAGVITGGALCLAAVALFVAALAVTFAHPLAGVCLFGASFVLAGIGILLLVLGIWIVIKVVPAVVRFIVKICRKPFEKREGGAGV